MNRKQQGDIGVAQAIFYYTKQGYVVSIPATDNSLYDLLVDNGNTIKRVQCKTTFTRSKHGVPSVELRTKGGNKSGNGKESRLSSDHADLLWACVEGEKAYEIPIFVVEGMATINLGEKYQQYKVMGL